MSEGELNAALVDFQSAVPAIPRSKTVRVRTKTGGEYVFAYAPLDVILATAQPVLAAQGLAVSQLLSSVDGRPSLRTLLLHKSGESLAAEFPLPIHGSETAQEIGSMVSYMRRYALISVLGLATEEDDDGNHASGHSVAATAGPDAATPAPPQVPVGAGTPSSDRGDGGGAGLTSAGDYVVKFGKYVKEAGQPLKMRQLPTEYVDWIANKMEAKNVAAADVKAAARAYLVELDALARLEEF